MSFKALLVKLMAVAGVSAILLPMLTHLNVSRSISFGLVLAVLSYIIGDWLILNYMGNMVATIADIGLAAIALRYYGGTVENSGVTWGDALVFGIVVGVFEYFFHGYLNRAEKTGTERRTRVD